MDKNTNADKTLFQEILMLSAAERQELAENAMEQLARLVDHHLERVVLQGVQGGMARWQGGTTRCAKCARCTWLQGGMAR